MPAQAGHPVITTIAVNTGSSAFADDDNSVQPDQAFYNAIAFSAPDERVSSGCSP
jgi:hypothetical protein